MTVAGGSSGAARPGLIAMWAADPAATMAAYCAASARPVSAAGPPRRRRAAGEQQFPDRRRVIHQRQDVEANLTRIYRTLGRGRVDLARHDAG